MASVNKVAARLDARGAIDRAGKFLREARAELRKVVWPTRKELTTYTAVVIGMVIVVSIFIGVVDLLLAEIMSLLSGIGG